MDDINQILTKNANVQKRNVFSFKNTVKYNYSQKNSFNFKKNCRIIFPKLLFVQNNTYANSRLDILRGKCRMFHI